MRRRRRRRGGRGRGRSRRRRRRLRAGAGRRSVLSLSGCAPTLRLTMALSPRSSTRSTRTARPPSAMRRSPGRMPMTTLRALRRLERDRQRRPGDADGVPFPLAGEQVHRRRADEAGDVDRHRPGEDLARRADLDDAAVHEDGDAVGERHRLFLVVGDVDGGDAERALELAQLEAGLEAQLGVEVGERLVEQEEARLANDRARQRDALLLAAGELARRSLQQVADADLGGSPGDGAADLVARDADHPERKADVLLDRHVRDRARSSGTPSRRRARRAPSSSRRRRP